MNPKKLQDIIKKSDFTQKEIADKLNITEATLSGYLKHENFDKFTFGFIKQLSNLLNITIGEMLGEVIKEESNIQEKYNPDRYVKREDYDFLKDVVAKMQDTLVKS